MDRQEFRDQAAHAGTVLLAVLPLALCLAISAEWPATLLAGVWAGLAIGFLAEVKERASAVTLDTLSAALHSWKDLAGYSTGGLIVAIGALIAEALV